METGDDHPRMEMDLIADSSFCRRREPQPAQPRTAEDASAVNSARGDTMRTASRIEDLP